MDGFDLLHIKGVLRPSVNRQTVYTMLSAPCRRSGCGFWCLIFQYMYLKELFWFGIHWGCLQGTSLFVNSLNPDYSAPVVAVWLGLCSIVYGTHLFLTGSALLYFFLWKLPKFFLYVILLQLKNGTSWGIKPSNKVKYSKFLCQKHLWDCPRERPILGSSSGFFI